MRVNEAGIKPPTEAPLFGVFSGWFCQLRVGGAEGECLGKTRLKRAATN